MYLVQPLNVVIKFFVGRWVHLKSGFLLQIAIKKILHLDGQVSKMSETEERVKMKKMQVRTA